MMISMSRTNRGMLDPLSAMKINKNIIRRVAWPLAWRLMPFFAVGSLMENDPNGVSWKNGIAEGALSINQGEEMISFLELYLTWLCGCYPEANCSSLVRQSVALNHPKNIHSVAASTSTTNFTFRFCVSQKGAKFPPDWFRRFSLFTQSRRRRRWEIYSHTRSPNITSASLLGVGKIWKITPHSFLFHGATKSPPAGCNFRCEEITLATMMHLVAISLTGSNHRIASHLVREIHKYTRLNPTTTHSVSAARKNKSPEN